MALFVIKAQDPNNNREIQLNYDTGDSSLTDETGKKIGFFKQRDYVDAVVFDKDTPVGKSEKPKILKIQLGLSCNYECSYCSQRFVPRAGETNPDDISDFLNNIEKNLNLGTGLNLKIELWGGEPFVYWKTMKPLVEKLHEKYPEARFSTITNGSLLTDDKIDWMYTMGFGFAISHDGPAMKYRGPDPFDDPETRRVILRAYKMFKPEGRISFNSMMHGENTAREPIIQFFKDFTGDENVNIGEGGLVDAYDDDAAAISLITKKQQFDFRRTAVQEFLTVPLFNWNNSDKVQKFLETISSGKPYSAITQKCGMDNPDNLAVDMKGNVLTCQNVSIVSKNPAGTSHLAGNIADIKNVKVAAATHLNNRKECPTCPVVHVCQGSCMFLQGDLWKVSCDNAYSDAIGPFAYGIYKLTGFIPVWIEHESLPDYRKDVFGSMVEHKETKKKPFPIPVVAG